MFRLVYLFVAFLFVNYSLYAYQEDFDSYSAGTPLSNVNTNGISYTALVNDFTIADENDSNPSQGKFLSANGFEDVSGTLRLDFDQPQHNVYFEITKTGEDASNLIISGYRDDTLVYSVTEYLRSGDQFFEFNNSFGLEVDRYDINMSALNMSHWAIDNILTKRFEQEPRGPFVWLAQNDSQTIAVIDTQSNMQTELIHSEACKNPFFIAMNPQHTKAYVTCRDTNNTAVFDTKTHQFLDSIPVGEDPRGIVITSNGKKAYVPSAEDNNVSVIDLVTHTVSKQIPVGNKPLQLAFTPDESRLYVINQGGKSLSIINTTTDTVVDTIDLDFIPWDIFITKDGAYAYVSNRFDFATPGIDNTIARIDLSDNTFTSDILGGTSTIEYVGGLQTTSNGKCLIVADHEDGGTPDVRSYDTATNALISNIYHPDFDEPWEVMIAPTDDYVYASQGDGANPSLTILKLEDNCSMSFFKNITTVHKAGHGMAWQEKAGGINPSLIMYLLN